MFSIGIMADDNLVTEMATEHVDITTQFTGEKILIFGAMAQPGGDVIIKVVSPPTDVALSHKKLVGPFWLDSGKMTIKDTPGLMYLLSSKPIEELLSLEDRDRNNLRVEDALLNAKITGASEDTAQWRTAFLRLKQEKNHYQVLDHAVKEESHRLFFSSLSLPAKIPLGLYHLEIYLVRDGKIVGQQSHNLDVREVRLERWVSDEAHAHSWMFGMSFTLFAMVLGLGLGILLRRNSDA